MHYRVDLTKTEYGHKDAAGATAYYYKWVDNGNGLEFEQTPDPSEAQITYYADSNRLAPDRITADQGGKPIDSDFLGKYVTSSYGGAIYNSYDTIGDITGDFIGNYVSDTFASGGAIYNANGTIGNIAGDFIGNYVASSYNAYGSEASGGAIFIVGGTIGDITGDFIGNYAIGYSSMYGIPMINPTAHGGAISSESSLITPGWAGSVNIGTILGNFINNHVIAIGENAFAAGGAIYNRQYSTGGSSQPPHAIDSITGNFIGNYATALSTGSVASGGAILNHSAVLGDANCVTSIGDITGSFINNYVSAYSDALGGAIANTIIRTKPPSYPTTYGTHSFIGNITGDFIGNYALSSQGLASGGAILNEESLGRITGDFAGNYVSGLRGLGGAIANVRDSDGYGIRNGIASLAGNFINNYAEGIQSALGGAIYNTGMILGYDVSADKLLQLPMITINISDTGESYTFYQGIPAEAEEELNAMLEAGYKVVYVNAGEQTMTSAEWEQMKPEVDAMLESGEMATEPQITDDKYLAQLTGGLVNSSFFGNYAKSAEGEAKGGAIYTTNSLTIAADNGNSVFSGNYVEDVNGKRPEAVYVDSSAATLTLQSKNDGTILFEDQINGASGYNLKLTGDETGRVILNNDVINAKIDLSEVTLQLGRDDVFNQSQALALNSGTLSLLNNGVGTMHLPELSLNGAVNMAVDADLANKTMDKITADNYQVSDDAQLNVDHINLISDANEDKTDIQFADRAFSNKVSYTGENPIAYSKIYKYDVSYNPNDGFFTFLRGSSTNASENYNPVVLAPAVANQTGAYSTQMQVFNYAFQHSDNFMNLPYIDRLAYSRENQYALINDSTVGPYSPIFTRVNQGGYWVKPYVSFESIPLKNGPKVSNIAYGSLIGYDSKLTPIRNGFERVLTGYVGYNGANQSYSGVDT